MNDEYAPRPVGWYMPAAILSLLLMSLPLIGSIIHLTTDPAALTLDQRMQFEAEPVWMVAMFALASLAGVAGGVMLIMKRRLAEPLMLVALATIGVWFLGLFANGQLRDLLSTDQIAMAIAIVAIVWTIFWFARHSRQRGWLS